MADRQDIDALMIGALYGELDAAESARLDAHLSKHPEDRAALDGLTRTRAALREQLDALPVAEPPQAVSALLLQAAARQAPARRGAAEASPSLWSRFLTWMRPLTMNPALAGAAAILLVGGTVTALYVRGGGSPHEPVRSEVHASAPSGAADSREGAPPAFAAGSGAAAPAADPAPTTDGYVAGLDKPVTQEQKLDERASAELDRATRKDSANVDKGGLLATPPQGEPRAAKAAGGQGKPAPTTGGIAVEVRDVAPDVKDAYPTRDGDGVVDDDSIEEESVAADEVAAARGAGATTARAPEPAAVDPALEEWAKGAHARLVKLVEARKCPEAGRLGAEIKDRAPDYYAARVANDRAIRSCKSYIEGQSKKKAEKDYKSRSQRNTVDAADELK
jgi:anti-sigma factor RsiW